MRSYWSTVGPKANRTNVLIKRGNLDTHTHRRTSREDWRNFATSQTTTRGWERDRELTLPWSLHREHGLILRRLASKIVKNTFLLFKPPSLWYCVAAALEHEYSTSIPCIVKGGGIQQWPKIDMVPQSPTIWRHIQLLKTHAIVKSSFRWFFCKSVYTVHASLTLPQNYPGFPGGISGKEPDCQRRRHKRLWFDPWVRKIPWTRAWQPTPVFLPGEFHGQRTWWVQSTGSHKSWKQLRWLSTHAELSRMIRLHSELYDRRSQGNKWSC